MILNRAFYERDTEIVAKELLGKIIVRVYGKFLLKGKIVETEAYYGKEDPASRVYYGKPKYVVELMKGEVGRALVYNVHNNWLLNVVAHEKNKVGAVLIRSIKPIAGIKIMMKNRKIENISNLTNGPGKLTKAFLIDKSFNNIDLTNEESILKIIDNKEKLEIKSSKRIGVSKDLDRNLRFFIQK
ncbi:MAG: DNA-3-methyladenine glycosylase [Candidatus Aenigmarchaeota archaeon]|nr:DNA-3-methyladenine glycosylase [Candidatus Aenigmarchaeota archaeon]MDW8149798.1 DNA-3-methyladenine glycosylase [Candidatus Aenigmarchaeota archaeon]